ncbi:hypothetical protein RSAG8_05232, partial [Rhizoctonia solani AG-8 WAC10335]
MNYPQTPSKDLVFHAPITRLQFHQLTREVKYVGNRVRIECGLGNGKSSSAGEMRTPVYNKRLSVVVMV